MAATLIPCCDEHDVLDSRVDDLLLHVRGLVMVRDLLIARGASDEEIDSHTEELDRRRLELAAIIGPGNWA
jgi:hypothetical protein